MDDKAVKKDDEGVAVVEDPNLEPGGEAKPGAEDGDNPGDGKGDEGEVEIVIDGETQPKDKGTPRGFLKRINKLNGKVDDANGQADDARRGTAEEREKRIFAEDKARVLEIALTQARGGGAAAPDSKPNPDDFASGIYDEGFIKAFDEYQDKRSDARAIESAKKIHQQTSVTNAEQALARDLEQSQTAHYERANKLRVEDYDATEDKAIEIFGLGNTNHLIANLDDSEVAFYYFGKNPEVAQKYADMMKTKPIKALIEIGRLISTVKVRPKSEPAPDPDFELEGGTPSNLEAMQLKLNKLRTAARTGKGFDKLITFKKQMKAKGIELG